MVLVGNNYLIALEVNKREKKIKEEEENVVVKW